MAIHIVHPYTAEPALWLKGNLHTHTSNSDGQRSPQETINTYAALGYDFLMLSDHDQITDPGPLDAKGLALIPGNEITADGPHILHVGASNRVEPSPDRQRVLDAIRADGGFAIVAHPNWEEDFNHCPQEYLESWEEYAGIEVYNGVVRFLPGRPEADDRWDRLLAQGRKVWGYAHDDCHWEQNYGIAWNVVQSPDRNPDTIACALRTGRFYASTGVVIRAISVVNNMITVETENAQALAVIADYGRRVLYQEGASLAYLVPENSPHSYLRIEAWGEGDSHAWTQPFFLERR